MASDGRERETGAGMQTQPQRPECFETGQKSRIRAETTVAMTLLGLLGNEKANCRVFLKFTLNKNT